MTNRCYYANSPETVNWKMLGVPLGEPQGFRSYYHKKEEENEDKKVIISRGDGCLLVAGSFCDHGGRYCNSQRIPDKVCYNLCPLRFLCF